MGWPLPTWMSDTGKAFCFQLFVFAVLDPA
jgi:hypothetical protein